MAQKEVVLELGVEGGGATIFRRPSLPGSGFELTVEGSSMDMDENDDEVWRSWTDA